MQESTRETTKTIMLELKQSTKPLHDATEKHEFQKLLGTGKINRNDYVTYLEQLYCIHSSLAKCLSESKESKPGVNEVVKDRHLDLTNLENDLGHFEVTGKQVKPLKATENFVGTFSGMKTEIPESLLGVLYVLEGSTHGAKYMAKTLRDGLGLSDRDGSSYFDRYQEKQMEYWLEFKKSMNEQNFSDNVQSEIIEQAKSTFQAFSDIGSEIIANSQK